MVYSSVRLMAAVILQVVNRLKVSSQTAIPSEGPLVVVANHESVIDGFVLLAVFAKRRLTFLSASYLFDKPFIGAFLRAVGALPVQREGNNFGSLRRAIAILERGGTVAVFPEGGVAHSEILGGAVYLALKAGAPILPLYLKGTREALPPGHYLPSPSAIEVVLGSPFHVPCHPGGPRITKSAVSEGIELLERMLEQTRSAGLHEDAMPSESVLRVVR